MSVTSPLNLRGLMARGPLLVAVRQKARINIQKPKLPHWEKARFLKLTEPQLPKPPDLLTEHLGCFHAVEVKPKKETNPLEVLLGHKIREACEDSRLMIFFHRNSMTLSEIHKGWQILKRAGFTYHKLFNNQIAVHAFRGTRYESVLQLCRSHTSLVMCPEARLARLLKLQKKLPQLVVIGGVVEDRFMSAPELERYARLPELDALRVQLSHLLSRPAAAVSASLNHHQSALVRSLVAHSGGGRADDSSEQN